METLTFAVRRSFLGFGIAAVLATTSAAQGADTNPALPQNLQVLIFWDTTCTYCKPVLQKMQPVRAKYPRVKFYAVSSGTAASARDFLRQRGLDYEVRPDGGALMDHYKVEFIPLVIITDGEGRVLTTMSDYVFDPSIATYVDMELYFRGAAGRRSGTRLMASARAASRRAN
ncbi:MAG: TlpA disulfide reductase family protein [Pseudomonadota bacterium]